MSRANPHDPHYRQSSARAEAVANVNARMESENLTCDEALGLIENGDASELMRWGLVDADRSYIVNCLEDRIAQFDSF